MVKKQCTLISFDVDGTLIHSVGDQSNKIHKTAFSAAFRDVFGIDTHIDIVKHHGSTDPLILLKVLQVRGVPPAEARDKLPELKQAMLAHFEAHRDSAGNGLQLLPGVLQLMQTLKETEGVVTCLVTGNLEPIGWGKMQALGLYDLFTAPVFGGFGSDHCSGNTEESWRDRAELVRIAAQKACAAGYEVTAHYHVGDTPQDILAAEEGGATAIGVLTGVFSREELLEVSRKSSTVVLEGLHNHSEFVSTVGL